MEINKRVSMSGQILPALEDLQKTIDQTDNKLSGAKRVQALEYEFDQLAQINDTMDNLIRSIDACTTNIDVVLSTSESTNKLLDLWIKILSQTSYTNTILSDKNWKGMSKNEEEYHIQLRKLDELQKRYNTEKQRREQEREAQNQKRLTQERRLREREEALRRRVYGGSSSSAKPNPTREGRVTTANRTANLRSNSGTSPAGRFDK